MKNRIYRLLLILPFLFSCVNLKQGKQEIIGIELSYSIPIYKGNSMELIQLNDSVLIYYCENSTLIREPYTSITYNNQAIQNGEFIISDDEKTIVEEKIKFRNFLFNEKAIEGLRYDSISVEKFKLFNVDSLLKKKTFKGSRFYDSTNDVLLEQRQDKKNGLVFEKYIPKIKFDDSYNDTTHLIFNPNFKPINYSISKEADSIKKMKLVEIKLRYNAKAKTSDNPIATPERVFMFRIKELKINNQGEIISLFERFKKDNKR